MPMQLAEACMSAKFINLHLFMGRRGGVEVKVHGGWVEGKKEEQKERDRKQHSCRLCPDQTSKTIRKEGNSQTDIWKYSLWSFEPVLLHWWSLRNLFVFMKSQRKFIPQNQCDMTERLHPF